MNILYIEDDIIDQKNCQLLFNTVNNSINVQFSNDFNNAIELLNNHLFNVIISDNKIGMDRIEDYPQLFINTPYFVISNSSDLSNEHFNTKPIGIFKKPLKQENIEQIISFLEINNQKPNFDYFEKLTMGDMSAAIEMATLIKNQMEESLSLLPSDYASNDLNKTYQTIHKVTSKFSLLNMKNSYDYFQETERHMKNLNELPYEKYVNVLYHIHVGNEFLKKYLEGKKVKS